jgi:hypothetical protein
MRYNIYRQTYVITALSLCLASGCKDDATRPTINSDLFFKVRIKGEDSKGSAIRVGATHSTSVHACAVKKTQCVYKHRPIRTQINIDAVGIKLIFIQTSSLYRYFIGACFGVEYKINFESAGV